MDDMDKTFVFRVFLLTVFVPISVAHALYEGFRGLKHGFMLELKDFLRLWKNPPIGRL